MTHSIARAAEPDAESLTGALQEKVVVGILVIGLNQVMVHILHRDLCPRPLQAHGFQFQHHQCPGCILGQSLVNTDTDHLPGNHLAFQEMGFDQFLRNIECHD